MTALPGAARAPPNPRPTRQPSGAHEPEWPPVPSRDVQARDDQDTYLVLDAVEEDITQELLRVGYATAMTWEAKERLYPQVRKLIRDALDQLREELRELDPRLILTSVND
jgi:hypothetical protein